jgi:hypothetical protein
MLTGRTKPWIRSITGTKKPGLDLNIHKAKGVDPDGLCAGWDIPATRVSLPEEFMQKSADETIVSYQAM